VQTENRIAHLGGVVKSNRKLYGLTQVQLAERLNITPRYLKAIENSGRKPSYGLLARIVRELEIPIETVLYSENETALKKTASVTRD
jgi:transcriptional regulator with XRE-family HTH domain